MQVLLNLALLTLGNAIFVVALNGVLVPQGFLTGGVLGLALCVHYLTPALSIGLLNLILNLPLYWLGWKHVSRRFMLYTAYGIFSFSFLAETLRIPPLQVHEPLLAAVLAGIIGGLGCGIYLRSAGSAGGLDILSVYLNKRFGLRPGLSNFMANAFILTGVAVVFSLDKALYALLFSFTWSRVTDAVLSGFNQRKAILIISPKNPLIARAILDRLNRGVTFLDGQGAYSGKPLQAALSVVTMTELARVKEIILGIDPEAFIIVQDTLEVLGKRHGRFKVW
jgi:uncharacterized membrane-anchored protein YitT (DUF2179 family)